MTIKEVEQELGFAFNSGMVLLLILFFYNNKLAYPRHSSTLPHNSRSTTITTTRGLIDTTSDEGRAEHLSSRRSALMGFNYLNERVNSEEFLHVNGKFQLEFITWKRLGEDHHNLSTKIVPKKRRVACFILIGK